MATRVINFGAGPAQLPLEVLEEAQKSLSNWKGTGTSIVEISHRSKEFLAVIEEAKKDLSTLLNIPDNYSIAFLQGGGTGQFASVPLNLTDKEKASGEYLVTGTWSEKAFKEAQELGEAGVAFKGDKIPSDDEISTKPNAAYLYYCDNETIHGVEFPSVPSVPGTTLVADMSSNFLSRAFDIQKFGVVFAGAQKNCGMAGVTILIIRNDLLVAKKGIPTVLNYKKNVDADSTLNTPPVFAIYVAALMFKWILASGGVAEMEKRNLVKSEAVYKVLDESNGFYQGLVADVRSRSRMNVVFKLPNDALEKKFVAEAKEKGMIGIQGHRSVGGCRVSLYNSVTVEEVTTLVEFMKQFQQQNAL
eukprot:TRINITY_DN17409_c0_g1_i1.p1 TRINITY_DN17409_c0_g1~~TRINITY_DN17409_c0_g1_i1.p1  ORF type:complete len:369 (-),score=94.99 TRINITY_DN17409_c0_g1_i1:8-1087(-)